MSMAHFDISKWSRLEHADIPIYIHAGKPDWFVPNRSGDLLLRSLAIDPQTCLDVQAEKFITRLPESHVKPYPGRSRLLTFDRLNELWLHITNQCNQACRHCMFACSPTGGLQLSNQKISYLAAEAWKLGCRVFALTGGEPFLHPEFPTIIDGLFGLPGAHVAVLTNGTLLKDSAGHFERWPMEKMHLQVSLDGLQATHDKLRGQGAFEKLCIQLKWLHSKGIPYTTSICINADNLEDLPRLVELAANLGCRSVHLMWPFSLGRSQDMRPMDINRIFDMVLRANQRARHCGIGIDNLDELAARVFSPPGTIHDGSNSAWDSLAVGPDGHVYPSAALVGIDELSSRIETSLSKTWRESPVLGRIRDLTIRDNPSLFGYLLGGGDLDHGYIHTGRLDGQDPYFPLHAKLALWLISDHVENLDVSGAPRLLYKMGDRLDACKTHAGVGLVHSNCLLSFAHKDTRTSVQDYYRQAAIAPRNEILNPAGYPDAIIEHVPETARVRAYGCGSPVLDAGIREGERVVDLGSGSGVECFIAAKQVGETGRVIGIDMLDSMLALARQGSIGVIEHLKYDNLSFRKGYLESLPLENDTVDLVLSNCVINLSNDKRATYREIFRILAPGGRLCISDVVCETEPAAQIRNNESLRGECIAGALTQRDLFGLLEETGFACARVINRFPYRRVENHQFFSMTYMAYKPHSDPQTVRVMYRGPFPAIVLHDGRLLPKGVSTKVPRQSVDRCNEDIYLFQTDGVPSNVSAQSCCSCAPTPERPPITDKPKRHRSGCMVCGADLTYMQKSTEKACFYCGKHLTTQLICSVGHFVCDACHVHAGIGVIEKICIETQETDMLGLLGLIRKHPSIPIHGPEHHAMIPGIILSTYRNLGGKIDNQQILTAVRRGAEVAGGYCAWMGICGVAVGVGIAFGTLLESNPLKARQRSLTQRIVLEIMQVLSSLEAARCCRRECVLALHKTAELSKKHLPITLIAGKCSPCRQTEANQECLGEKCPLRPVET